LQIEEMHRLRRTVLRSGVENGMKLAIGLLGRPYAWALGVQGEVDDAAAWMRRIAKSLPGAHRFLFAFLVAAQFGVRSDVVAMRRLLVEAASHLKDRLNVAVLGLSMPSPASAASLPATRDKVRSRPLQHSKPSVGLARRAQLRTCATNFDTTLP
jgi:hypothetical protein